jgi:outer membrane protein OmpA-like peptidoglycan-associated protein
MEAEMQASGVFIALALATFSMPAIAQNPKVLKGNEITEAALIEALAPPVVTRSIRPGGGPAAAAKPPAQGIMIVFATNSIELTPDGKQKLDIVGRALNADKLVAFTFQVEGHADRRGPSDWNQRLSEGRAEAVRQYLVQYQNVGPERLKPVGKGDREPLNTENPAAAENRRVTFVTNVQ